MIDLAEYRANVGVALFNAQGQVWIGRRKGFRGRNAWQMPQGGVDHGEDYEAAALRELKEETGVAPDKVRVLMQLDDWLTYDFPSTLKVKGPVRGYRGQKQRWFALRFLGVDADIALDRHTPEFDAWRWETLSATPGLVAPFKRDVYAAVARAFAPIAAGKT